MFAETGQYTHILNVVIYLKLEYVFRQTPLHLAVLNNHEGAVLAIIEHKKLVEKGDMSASDRSNVSLTPNLNLKNSEGDTPVGLALTEGSKVSDICTSDVCCKKIIYLRLTDSCRS